MLRPAFLDRAEATFLVIGFFMLGIIVGVAIATAPNAPPSYHFTQGAR